MATTNHGAIVTPDGSGTVNAVTALAAMSASIEPGVVGYYADETARDAGTLALRNAGKKGMRAFVLAPVASNATGPDWCGWNGTEWIWDHPTPVEWSFSSGGGPAWTQTTVPVNWATATFPFTPNRTGWADVSFIYDVVRLNTGFSAAYAWVKFTPGGGAPQTLLGIFDILYDSEARRSGQWRIPKRVRLIAGQGATFTLEVSSFIATPGVNQWQMGNFIWSVVQQ